MPYNDYLARQFLARKSDTELKMADEFDERFVVLDFFHQGSEMNQVACFMPRAWCKGAFSLARFAVEGVGAENLLHVDRAEAADSNCTGAHQETKDTAPGRGDVLR